MHNQCLGQSRFDLHLDRFQVLGTPLYPLLKTGWGDGMTKQVKEQVTGSLVRQQPLRHQNGQSHVGRAVFDSSTHYLQHLRSA